jgi:hypothetical protein
MTSEDDRRAFDKDSSIHGMLCFLATAIEKIIKYEGREYARKYATTHTHQYMRTCPHTDAQGKRISYIPPDR